MSGLNAGQEPAASDLQVINDLNSAWVDYSSTFSILTSGTATTKGNSQYTARYKQIGKIVIYEFFVQIGSTFAIGTGDYHFPLPVTALSTGIAALCGAAYVQDSGTAFRPGVLANSGGATGYVVMYLSSGVTGNALGSIGSGTAWAAGDQIVGSITYEAA